MKALPLTFITASLLLSGCATNSSSTGSEFMDSVSSTASSMGSAVGNAASSLFGSYENGIYISPEQLSKIIPGKTKSSDIVALLGHPTKKEQLNNKVVWSYPYTKISHFGANVNETTVVEIDSKGLVLSAYKAGGRSDSTGNPLVDAANGVN